MHTKKNLLAEDFQIFFYTIPIQYKHTEEGFLSWNHHADEHWLSAASHTISLANIYLLFCKITINTDKILSAGLTPHLVFLKTQHSQSTCDNNTVKVTGHPQTGLEANHQLM